MHFVLCLAPTAIIHLPTYASSTHTHPRLDPQAPWLLPSSALSTGAARRQTPPLRPPIPNVRACGTLMVLSPPVATLSKGEPKTAHRSQLALVQAYCIVATSRCAQRCTVSARWPGTSLFGPHFLMLIVCSLGFSRALRKCRCPQGVRAPGQLGNTDSWAMFAFTQLVARALVCK